MMKTILILTTGSRDVQLKNREEYAGMTGKFDYRYTGSDGMETSVPVMAHAGHPESYALYSMRSGCQQLRRDYEHVKDFLVFPMIVPAVEYVIRACGRIDEILFVVTDQEKEPVPENFKEKDTIRLPPLVKKYLKDIYAGKIDRYYQVEADKKLTDIDFWYDRFDEYMKNQELVEESDESARVYFLPQGGIDQINQALTLRLIEYFPKLVQLQIPEGGAVQELKFPEKFLFNITRHKMREMAQRYQFATIRELNLTRHVEIDLLAGIGDALVRMDKKDMRRLVCSGKFRKATESIPVAQKLIRLFLEDDSGREVLHMVYLSARIKYEQGLAGETLWRLATLNELLLKRQVVELLEWKDPGERQSFPSLNQSIQKNRELFNYLKQKKVFNGSSVRPSTRLYDEIIRFFKREKQYSPDPSTENLHKILEQFLGPRNMLIHQAIGISSGELDDFCREKYKKGILPDMKALFNEHLGPYFNIQGTGILGELKDEILRRL